MDVWSAIYELSVTGHWIHEYSHLRWINRLQYSHLMIKTSRKLITLGFPLLDHLLWGSVGVLSWNLCTLTFMNFHLQKDVIYSLHNREQGLPVSVGERFVSLSVPLVFHNLFFHTSSYRLLLVRIQTLDVEHRPRRLDVAERNLAQAAFQHQLACLRVRFGGCYCSSNLLFHSLHVVILTSVVPSSTTEEVGLSKLAKRLLRICPSPDGRMNNVVKVFICVILGITDRYELLELDPLNEVLVLRCHKAIISRLERR